MFCTACGAQIEEDAAFCTSCGAPIRGAEPDADVAATVPLAGAQTPAQAAQPGYDPTQQQQFARQTPQYQQAYQQPPTKTSHRGVLIVVLVIAIAAAVAAALYFSGIFDKDDKDSAAPASTAQVSGNAQQPQNTEQNAGAQTSSSAAQEQQSPAQTQAQQTSPAPASQGLSSSGNSSVSVGDRFFDDTVYTNARYGYSILIPAGFECIALSENGDGGHFANDYGVSLSTYGYNNFGGEYSLEGRYDTMVRDYNPEYSTILEDKSAFVVSWVSGNTEYYHMEYVGSGSVQAFDISYAAGDSRGDAIVEQIQPTFTAGDIWNEH